MGSTIFLKVNQQILPDSWILHKGWGNRFFEPITYKCLASISWSIFVKSRFNWISWKTILWVTIKERVSIPEPVLGLEGGEGSNIGQICRRIVVKKTVNGRGKGSKILKIWHHEWSLTDVFSRSLCIIGSLVQTLQCTECLFFKKFWKIKTFDL